MTQQEFDNNILEFKNFLDPTKGVIQNREHEKVKSFINFYFKLTGKKVGEGTCRNCILDAFFHLRGLNETQLKHLLMEKKYILKKTKVVGFGGSHYTNANITDEVAFKMIVQSRSNAGHFENGEQLLSDFAEENKLHIPVEKPEKKKVEEKKEVTDLAEGVEVSITEKEDLPEAPKKKKGKKKK